MRDYFTAWAIAAAMPSLVVLVQWLILSHSGAVCAREWMADMTLTGYALRDR